MKCVNCGYKNNTKSEFCERCGAPLQNSGQTGRNTCKAGEPPKTDRGISKKKKLWAILIGAVVCIAVVAAIIIVSASRPINKITGLLDQGKLDEALAIYNESRMDMTREQKAEIIQRLSTFIENSKEMVHDDPECAEQAYATLDSVASWMFKELDEPLDDAKTYIESLTVSHEHFLKAEQLMASEDYRGAMTEYLLVSTSDSQYELSQTQYDNAYAAFCDAVLTGAAEKMENEDFFGAIEILNDGMKTFPNEHAFGDKAAQYQQEYVQGIISEADALAKQANFVDALTMLKNAKDKLTNKALDDAYMRICDSYVDDCLTKANEFTAKDDPFAAINCLKTALGVVPDSDELRNLLNEYNWDDTLYEDEQYVIVRKNFEDYNSYSIRVGVWDKSGKWIVPLSEDFIFATAIQEQEGQTSFLGSKTQFNSKNFAYLGEGVFIASLGVDICKASGARISVGNCSSLTSHGLDVYFYNVLTNATAKFCATQLSYCSNGYMLMYNSSRYGSSFFNVTANGEVTGLPVRHEAGYNGPGFSGYTDGLFFANGFFYDIQGNAKINLTDFDLLSTPYFENGECTLVFKNEAGTEYTAVIDTSGHYISEPHIK